MPPHLFDWCWTDSDSVVHCYYVTDQVQGIDEARASCLSGTNLITILSAEEMAVLSDIISARKMKTKLSALLTFVILLYSRFRICTLNYTGEPNLAKS